MIDGSTLLVTGGTGSFGHALVRTLLASHRPKKLIVFSRDEYKQSLMAQAFPVDRWPIRYFLGDVRDRDRLYRAFAGVDVVVHAAALKQVPALEYNPFEAVKTNILGAENIVDAAIDRGVRRVVALSTDKAVSPVNLYGATKLTMEKIFVAANAYAGGTGTAFSMVRYGNVASSRGSVIPLFLDLRRRGCARFPVTDERMTRFWITLEQSVDLVLRALDRGRGGEIFVPRLPSMRILDLVAALAPGAGHEVIGIRPGEKLHETLIAAEEARHTVEDDGTYVILPEFEVSERDGAVPAAGRRPVAEDFVYRSDRNDRWLSVEELRAALRAIETDGGAP